MTHSRTHNRPFYFHKPTHTTSWSRPPMTEADQAALVAESSDENQAPATQDADTSARPAVAESNRISEPVQNGTRSSDPDPSSADVPKANNTISDAYASRRVKMNESAPTGPRMGREPPRDLRRPRSPSPRRDENKRPRRDREESPPLSAKLAERDRRTLPPYLSRIRSLCGMFAIWAIRARLRM